MTVPNPRADAESTLDDLRHRLRRLHRERGEPSTRAISKIVLNELSHSTVGAVLRCARLPRWERLQAVVTALDGDVDEFRAAWVAVRDRENPMLADVQAPTPPSRPESFSLPRKRGGSPGLPAAGAPGDVEITRNSLDGAPDNAVWISQPPLTGHDAGVVTLQFDATGSRLASGGLNGDVRLWAIRDRPVTGRLTGIHGGPVWGLAFSPDGTTLASASSDSTVRLLDLTNDVQTTTPLPPPEPVRLADPAAAQHSGREASAVPVSHSEGVWSAVFSPDGRLLATGSGDRTAILWDPATGAPACPPLLGHADSVTCLAFSPDSQILATGSHDAIVRLWDARTGTAASRALSGSEQAAQSIAISPDGRARVLPRSEDDPEVTGPIGHTDAITAMAFSSDGHDLATASLDAVIWLWTVARLWHPVTGELLGMPLRGHTDAVIDIAISPTAPVLASAGADSTVRLWDIDGGKPLHPPLEGHAGAVQAVAFHPSGTMLASAGDDATIRLWNPATGRPVGAPLAGHTGAIGAVAFSPDGTLLASCSDDGTVRLWTRQDPATYVGELLQRLDELQHKYDQALERLAQLDGTGIAAWEPE